MFTLLNLNDCIYLDARLVVGLISGSQALTLPISTITDSRSSPPAPTIWLTGVDLSLTSRFTSLLFVSFNRFKSVRPHRPSCPRRRQNSSGEVMAAAYVSQRWLCLSRPCIKGPIPIPLIILGCTCHAQHWHGGVLSMSGR